MSDTVQIAIVTIVAAGAFLVLARQFLPSRSKPKTVPPKSCDKCE